MIKRIYTATDIRGDHFLLDDEFARLNENELDRLKEACQAAANAAGGDSNDDEIQTLQEALEFALSLLGLEMPDAEDEDEED